MLRLDLRLAIAIAVAIAAFGGLASCGCDDGSLCPGVAVVYGGRARGSVRVVQINPDGSRLPRFVYPDVGAAMAH